MLLLSLLVGEAEWWGGIVGLRGMGWFAKSLSCQIQLQLRFSCVVVEFGVGS